MKFEIQEKCNLCGKPTGRNSKGNHKRCEKIQRICINRIAEDVLWWAEKWGYKGISPECEKELKRLLGLLDEDKFAKTVKGEKK